MKALIVSGPSQIGVEEIKTHQPDQEKVLIKVAYAGICGSDLNAWMRGDKGGARGHEFSGTVVDPGASGFAVGDRVTAMEITPCGECGYCKKGLVNLCPDVMRESPGISAVDGGMAEYVLVRPDMVRKLPDNVDDIVGAMTEPAAIATHAVRLARVGGGSRILILGAGPIGMFCAAVSKALGASYIAATEVNEKRIDFAAKSGYLDDVFHAQDDALSGKLSAGGKFDAIIDCSHIDVDLEMLSFMHSNGTYMDVGMKGDFKVNKTMLGMREYFITGSFFFLPADFDDTLEMLGSEKLDIRQLATKIADFSEAQACFEELHSGQSGEMKILFKI